MVYLLAVDLEKQHKKLENLKNERNEQSKKKNEIALELGKSEKSRIILLKQLKTVESEIKCLKSEDKKISLIISDLNMKLKKMKKIVESAIVIEVIKVDGDDTYGLRNGLVDLNRDILMQLIQIINNEKKIKNVFLLFFVGKEFSDNWNNKDFLWME
jgi:chromosome segregation ATPase